MILEGSFDITETIRIIANEIESLKREVEALKRSASTSGPPAPEKKLARARSESLS